MYERYWRYPARVVIVAPALSLTTRGSRYSFSWYWDSYAIAGAGFPFYPSVMSCAFCGTRIPILQVLAGSKYCCPEHRQMESEDRVGIQRLLDFAMSAQPEPIKRVTTVTIPSAVPDTQVPALHGGHSPDSYPETDTAAIECSLSNGSWRCRCQSCLSADKSN